MRMTPADVEAKLVLVKDYMVDRPDSTKRSIMRKFGVSQYVIAQWERDNSLVFRKVRPNINFNKQHRRDHVPTGPD